MILEKIKPEGLSVSPLVLIGKEWMLIPAGTEQRYNMTAVSRGALGVFWGKNMTSVYIRLQRYTLEFVNEQEYYAPNFFEDSYKKALAYRDAHSDRDVDKAGESGLTPVFDVEAPYSQEAKLVLICRKLHYQKPDLAGSIDPALDGRRYPKKDHRHIFRSETVEVLQKK